jgi:type I restriction enzyme S subunit
MSTWSTKPLGELITFQRGFDLPFRDRRPGVVPIVTSAGVTDWHDRAICSAPGVVTGRYGTIGELFYIERDYWPLNTTLFVKDFKGNNPKFIFYMLQRFDFSAFSGKSGVPGVNRNDLHAERVVFPSDVYEQETIAETLSDVDASIAAQSKLIAKKRDIRQGTIQRLLTGRTRLPGFKGRWEFKFISEFTDCTAGGTPSTKIAGYWGGKIRWMSSGELHKKEVWDVIGRITKRGLDESTAKLIPPHCVLVGLAGQGKTRGTVAINMVALSTNQSIAAIFPGPTFSSKFLFYVLQDRYEELRELSSGDGGRGGLNLKLIKSVRVPFPKIDEQNAIARVLSSIDIELDALESRLKKTCMIKQAMMQVLLTGRVRLPVTRDPIPKSSEAVDG